MMFYKTLERTRMMLYKTLCFLGWHKWEYKNVGHNYWKMRICLRCNKAQGEYLSCTYNSPIEWRDL